MTRWLLVLNCVLLGAFLALLAGLTWPWITVMIRSHDNLTVVMGLGLFTIWIILICCAGLLVEWGLMEARR
jgi:drug/metabolite transporter (DMT)-like permease